MPRYRLGDVVHDLTTRTLVMGILNRTPDSFYDGGLTYDLDDLVRRAEVLVDEGADILDIGGGKAGPGAEGGGAGGLDRVIPSIQGGAAPLYGPISCRTRAGARRHAACAPGPG